MEPENAVALDQAVADIMLQFRGLSDVAKDTAAKWNKVYSSSWHEAEMLKHAGHSCGGSQGCPLQNARCAAAAASLRYKSALNIAMTFMSFTLQGVHGLRANLTPITVLLQELLSGNLQGANCFVQEYGAQVHELLAKVQGLRVMLMAAVSPQPQPASVSTQFQMNRCHLPHMSFATSSEAEVVKRPQEQAISSDATSRKRMFDESVMSMEGECRSFQHEDKRRKQR